VIDAAGRIAIGATAAFSDAHKFAILGGLPSSAGVTAGFVLRVLVPSSSTNNFISCLSNIGTEAASYTVNSLEHYAAAQQSLGAGSAIGSQYGFVARDSLTGATNNFGFWSNIASGTGRWNFYANGTAQNYFGGQVLVTAGSGSSGSYKPGLSVSGDDDTGLMQTTSGGANTLSLVTNGSERVRVDASGAVGIGMTPTALPLSAFSFATSDANKATLLLSGTVGSGQSFAGIRFSHNVFTTGWGADILCVDTGNFGGILSFRTSATGSATATPTERLRIDASGNVGIGVTPTQRLHVARSGTGIAARFTDNSTQTLDIGVTASAGVYYDNPNSGYHEWQIGGSRKMRVDASGNVLVGTTNTDPAGGNVVGTAIGASGYFSITRDSFDPVRINIKSADGTLVSFFQDGASEGSISVAGNTVSYNAFCGSHWAQLSDQSRPAILRGTVMETIDAMCDWPEDGGSSDRLVRVKVSDTQSSRRVYGVFLGWDGQYASTGDMYVAGLGAYMVRVSGVVQSGDLIESAGDGTARTQADDIVRSTTIGKVSSTHRIAEYDDGSYLVPCVLMCG
jgi:hypothetical protein